MLICPFAELWDCDQMPMPSLTERKLTFQAHWRVMKRKFCLLMHYGRVYFTYAWHFVFWILTGANIFLSRWTLTLVGSCSKQKRLLLLFVNGYLIFVTNLFFFHLISFLRVDVLSLIRSIASWFWFFQVSWLNLYGMRHVFFLISCLFLY